MTANRGNSEDRCECGGKWIPVYAGVSHDGITHAVGEPIDYICHDCQRHKPREGGEEG